MRHHNIPASYLVLKRDNKFLLSKRINTGYKDGMYSLVAGHVEDGETFTDGLIREAKEEAGLKILANSAKMVHLMHRRSQHDDSQRVDVFFLIENFDGEPKNLEPEKCEKLEWFSIADLPENTIPYIRRALENITKNILYSEHGWKE